MADQLPAPGNRLPKQGGESSQLRITVKDFAVQYGVTGREVIEVVNKYRLEPEREADGGVTYLLEDLVHSFSEYVSESGRRSRETEMEFFRRILPEIKNSIAEGVADIVRQELSLAVAVKDTKDSILVELLGSLRGLIRENRGAISFLTRLTSQVQLAAVAGITTTLPTSGMDGSSGSLGVDIPLPPAAGIPARVPATPLGTPATPTAGTTSGTTATRGSPAVAATPVTQPHAKTAGGGQGPGRKAKGAAAASAQPAAKDAGPGGVKGDVGQAASEAGSAGPGSMAYEISPVMSAMLPNLGLLPPEKSGPLSKNILFLDQMFQMADFEISGLSGEEVEVIDEILKPWRDQISDIPRFTTFFGSFSAIQGWVSEKTPAVPLGVVFLALNRSRPGCISAADFLDMCAVV